MYLLHQPANGATTGTLLIVGITALAGMAAHARAGHVRLAQGMLFGLIGVAGSYAGTRLPASADPHLLLTAFAALMLVAAAAMALRRRRDAGPAHAAGAGGTASDTASDAARPAADEVGGDIAAGQVDAAGGGHVRSPRTASEAPPLRSPVPSVPGGGRGYPSRGERTDGSAPGHRAVGMLGTAVAVVTRRKQQESAPGQLL